mmetsp:Transcript_146786/g.471230  ORF Transcript_146786/g.471230 Transcript_146786/m.471230 type:complete len:1429 (+) Transcript_146786:147-4433(+)
MQNEWKANTGYYSLFQRSVKTVFLARQISKAVRNLERELDDQPGLDEEEVRARWAALHRENAKLAHKHILRYRGFLTKVGQAASVKAGELPRAWVEELAGLQDELPVSSLRAVRQTIRADLGRPVEQLFVGFSDRPIASASVAQAHSAQMRSSGQKVCVKVQHRGVASMVGADLATVDWICKRASKYHTNAPDATDLIREWRRACKDEVDFTIEAASAAQASAGLRRMGLNVGCVQPIPEACGRRVLTMAFIEGFKITDVGKLPAGANREAIARPLVDAFAALAFEEGLIHGDPHPGNIFVEQLPGGELRPALLDWGIVQRMTLEEREGAARWVLATLAQDRVLYLRSLLELGFVFDDSADVDSSAFSNFVEASMSSSVWMFRDSIPSGAQLHLAEQMNKLQGKQMARMAAQDGASTDRNFGKVLRQVPGVVLFFLRALGMLQQICGSLEIAVPFAEVILRRAMPVLMKAERTLPRPLPAPLGCSMLEQSVRGKLQELDEAGALLGAQVAVLSCPSGGASGGWMCRVAAGRRALAGGPLTESMLLPLLDASAGVLLLCLLASFQRPTVQGKRLTLDTPVSQVWPDFAQRDKGSITIGQVLQHRAGLRRLWPSDVTLKGFLTEQRMEQAFAACPREVGEESASGSPPCRGVGLAVAALLRRAVGKKDASEAVKSMLQAVSLERDIVFHGDNQRLAHAGRRPQERLPIEEVYEWMEEKIDSLEREAKGETHGLWLTWEELAAERPVCTDALLANRESLRSGGAGNAQREGSLCVPGRGLRASAEALCQLFSADMVDPEILETSKEPVQVLRPSSQDEWRAFGAPLEVSAGGWRLFRFRSRGGGGSSSAKGEKGDRSSSKGSVGALARKGAAGPVEEEVVVGYGAVDGSTGSVIVRLPEHCVAVLLTCADKDTRYAGAALLDTICEHLGLEPLWDREAPHGLPLRTPAVRKVDPDKAAMTSICDGSPDSKSMQDLQEKVNQLTAALEKTLPGTLGSTGGSSSGLNRGGGEGKCEDVDEAGPGKGEKAGGERSAEDGSSLVGTWESLDTEGLDEMLEAFEVPKMVRAMAARARRTLKIELDSDKMTFSTSTFMMGRTVEETCTSFVVGESFEGEQALGGDYTAISWWIDRPNAKTDGEADGPKDCLAVEKHFQMEGTEIVLEERVELQTQDRLVLVTTLKAPDDREATVADAKERDLLASCLELEGAGLVLKKALVLGEERLLKTGRIVSCGPGAAPTTLDAINKMALPGTVTLRYADMKSSTRFQREGAAEAKAASSWRGQLFGRAANLLGLGSGAAAAAGAGSSGGGDTDKAKPDASGSADEDSPTSKEAGSGAAASGEAAARGETGCTAFVGRGVRDYAPMAGMAVGGCALGAVALGAGAVLAAGTVLMMGMQVLGGTLLSMCSGGGGGEGSAPRWCGADAFGGPLRKG